MTQVIWKARLGTDGEVSMPKGAEILTVQTQHEIPCLWFKCDPSAEIETRKFSIIGTGHPITVDEGEYIGTFQVNDGAFVFHLFEDVGD